MGSQAANRGVFRCPPTALGLFLCLSLGACGCPPALADYSAPERTLASWQGSLCRNEAKSEYACLARSFHDDIGGFGNYHAWRQHMLSSEPLLSTLIKRSDLSDDIIETGRSPDGDHARLVLSILGGRLDLSFDREVWVTLHWSDGRSESFRQPETFMDTLQLTSTGQWLQLARPDISEADLSRIEAVHFDTRWLLSGFRTGPPEA